MPLGQKVSRLGKIAKSLASTPRLTTSLIEAVQHIQRGVEYARGWRRDDREQVIERPEPPANPLRDFVKARVEGHGVWKWDHYHDIYHRHLQRFIGREVHVVEVGVYSGGSLDMWRSYFGEGCRIYGVDIEDACHAYEDERTQIFIGDQADRGFWRDVRSRVPRIDVLIDDGGHEREQQTVTLEEMLPHLSPGGVFLCEDVFGEQQGFNDFVHGLVNSLCRMGPYTSQGVAPSAFQADVASVHTYPFVTVVEKNPEPVDRFFAEKHGTLWQPFLDDKCDGAAGRPDQPR